MKEIVPPRAQKIANAIALCAAAHGWATVSKADVESVTAVESDAPVQLPSVEVNASPVATAVTSPKFTEPVVDTPQTVDVIPPDVYQAQSATTLSDVLRNTPGITFFAGEGGGANRTGGDSFYLRGFDTSNSIFVDGVREEGAVVHDVFDVGQVEVFKGPSPENGRGGTAGYVNMESKLPQAGAFEDLQNLYGFGAEGSRGSERATLDLNEPLPASPVAGTAFRLNLMDQEGGIPGRQIAENNRWGVAPSLALGLGTPTRVFVESEHLYEHNLPDYGLPATALPGFAPAALGLYSPDVNPANYYGFANYDREQVTDDAFLARVEHDFSEQAKITEQIRYDGNRRYVEGTSPQGNATTPAGDATLSHSIYDTTNDILSSQANLKSSFDTGPVKHDLSAGFEASRETADNPTWAVVPLGAAVPSYLVNIYSPDNFPPALVNYDPHATGTRTDVRIDTLAWYGFDTIKLDPQWELTGGLRLEHYDVDELAITAASPTLAAQNIKAATASTLATGATAAVAAVPASDVELGANRTTASWKAGLVYKPAPDGSIYVSYDTSVRPPGTSGVTNTLSSTVTSADNPLLQPETSVNYEAGAKWSFFDERFLTTLALFRSVNSNVPAADPVSGLVDQTSNQTVQGVELSASGKITSKWLLFAGYSHLEPKVSNEISTNAQGLTLPLLPKDSGNLWTTYALPHGFTVGGGLQYMGETERLQATQAPTATTFSNQAPAYWLFNAMVSYAVNKHLTLRLNVTNAGNKEYIASLNNNGYRVNLGAPRTFLLNAELKY
ncbi:MAG TPA: TonB-dependent receptor [Opitutaceae bacterium]|jgi:catecholate siderophore receptor